MHRALVFVLMCASPAAAAPVTIPFNVGVGPSLNLVSGPVFRDQPGHFGIELRLQAVIDKETIAKNRDRIPQKYRRLASQVEEVRISPSIFIPESVMISPPIFGDTGLYGATWKVLNLGVPFAAGPARLRLSAGLLATLLFLHSQSLVDRDGDRVGALLFLRPGIDLAAELEVKLDRDVLVSLGWASNLYLPQVVDADVGRSFFSVAGDADTLRESIWHIGQVFLVLHIRFPRVVDL